VKDVIRVGNIVRTRWPQAWSDHLNLYMGSGRGGAMFDPWGLMNAGYRGRMPGCPTRTTLMHADHWHRGAWGLDYWLPVLRLVWADEPPAPPTDYRQELDLWDGRLRTEMAWPGLRLALTATFHPGRRDLLAVLVEYDASTHGAMPAMRLAPETDLATHYDQRLTGTAGGLEFDEAANAWLCRVQVGSADSVTVLRIVSARGETDMTPGAAGMEIRFDSPRGRHLLLIGAAAAARQAQAAAEAAAVVSPEAFMAEAAQAWHARWGDAWIDLPAPEHQALWARSLFYTLASYAPDVRSPAPPMGWSGAGWPFHFPQDVSYIHPALLRLGHLDIARSWVEFYNSQIETMREYTEDVYGARGVMWAWEFPIGPDSHLLREGTPNWCQFEIHNAAYPARMAREAALYARDPAWAEDVAWPVVRESARFFGSVLARGEDGAWGIALEPSFGQDELGGRNARNYLCALTSARYALQTAVTMADEVGDDDPDLPRWRQALADGLAFGRLLDADEGIYMTCEGLAGSRQFGRQKHPVQLNPLTFLPLGEADEPCRTAYRRRHDLCQGVRERFFHGWTGAAYWLAASHSGDGEGLLADLALAQPADYVDPCWITIYETSGSHGAPFYVTSHGVYLQAMTDALVTDFWGKTRVGAACPNSWREVRFHRLRTADGSVRSGNRTPDGWRVEVEDAGGEGT
jgi:hypothetical protein